MIKITKQNSIPKIIKITMFWQVTGTKMTIMYKWKRQGSFVDRMLCCDLVSTNTGFDHIISHQLDFSGFLLWIIVYISSLFVNRM